MDINYISQVLKFLAMVCCSKHDYYFGHYLETDYLFLRGPVEQKPLYLMTETDPVSRIASEKTELLGSVQNNEVCICPWGKSSIQQEDFPPANWT